MNDVAFLAFTGDDAGGFRAVVLTHANVVSSALRVSIARGDGPDDVALATHPTCDVDAFVAEILSRLISGGAIALLGAADATGLAERIESHRVTDVSLSAGLVSQLCEGRSLPRRAVRSVRKVSIRDPLLPFTLKRSLGDRFPQAELIQSYGCAEATDGILVARYGSVFRKPDTIGTPHPGLVVAIADTAGNLLRSGATGEIVCRGAVVMRGYHRAPKPTGEALRGGWLHTGDLGYIDGDGEIALVARRGRAAAGSATRAGEIG